MAPLAWAMVPIRRSASDVGALWWLRRAGAGGPSPTNKPQWRIRRCNRLAMAFGDLEVSFASCNAMAPSAALSLCLSGARLTILAPGLAAACSMHGELARNRAASRRTAP